MKKKTWSRRKIADQFTGMVKADGSPMSRQQVHMLRKKARGICLTCGEPAIGVYCLKHTVAARERMRQKLKYRRRLKQSPSYVLEKENRGKGPAKRRATGPVGGRLNARTARMPRSKALAKG